MKNSYRHWTFVPESRRTGRNANGNINTQSGLQSRRDNFNLRGLNGGFIRHISTRIVVTVTQGATRVIAPRPVLPRYPRRPLGIVLSLRIGSMGGQGR